MSPRNDLLLLSGKILTLLMQIFMAIGAAALKVRPRMRHGRRRRRRGKTSPRRRSFSPR